LGQGFAQGWFYGHMQAIVTGNAKGSAPGDAVELMVTEAAAPFGQGRSFRLQDWDKVSKAATE
jgi:hypothetical protein